VKQLSGIEDIKSKIQYCKDAIEPYRSYGDIAVQALNALSELETLIVNLDKQNLEKALAIARELDSEVAPYSSFLPTVADYLRTIKDWLEERSKG